jgi:hypothetical protein
VTIEIAEIDLIEIEAVTVDAAEDCCDCDCGPDCPLDCC